ncbi:putative virion structural protein [Pseudomonas phage OBP]|uniref:putative virion structural protein n=1 Tax=Pseudomonas phage OBP TaxID=1124849 RepID=UPI000240D55A|nr:putative virion structural protein [Pseudomonas phage OBP]AEV89570.1 putative virion structural protein [Pseudomonas phage OBP]
MLKNIEFKSYIMRTISFARTIVIKCEDIAFLDNRLMEQHYGIVPGKDKTQWRYYLNLNGDYHVTDDKMQVQSLDNGDTIEFTKANLDLHLATKRAYRQGSYYYTRLVEKYPHQSNLINGIINPIPPSESIPAKNYQILRYNTDYVMWNEYQLINALQDHIDTMVQGSFKTEYLYTDNLMLPIMLANLHGSLVSAILMIRKEADGTRYAHDFYIWSRLSSLGLSTIYKNVLNQKQTMWLYRNLEYVLRKQGRRKTFDELVDIVLTERRIPISRYEAIQTTEDMLETFKPKPMFLSRPVNLQQEFGLDTRIWTVPEVIRKERPLALDNEDEEEQGIYEADYNIKYGLHSDIPSKVLESNMTDTTDRNPDRIMRVLHNHWIYLTSKGLYNINVDVTDIRTGKHFRVTTQESIILWHYLINRSRGVTTCTDIPEYPYYHVRKITPPTFQELRELGHKDILTEEVCKDILLNRVDFPTLISPDGFFTKCKEVQDRMWDHKKLYSYILNLFHSSRRQNAVEACYETGVAKIGNYKTYDEFLLKLDLDYYDYTPDECLDLAWAIWSKVTGWEFNDHLSIGAQQRLLINLMKDLTSYTVQYIGSTETLEGQFSLPYMMLLDGDYYFEDGETALESLDNKLQIPGHVKGIPEMSLEAKELTGSLPGDNWGRTDPESIGCAKIDLPMVLRPIEFPPEPSVYRIMNSMTLKEVIDYGTP